MSTSLAAAPAPLATTVRDDAIVFDEALIRRYDKSGPRYTSYPTAVQFQSGFDPARYVEACRASDPGAPLSLYFHIPFCDTVCYYCACNKVVTKDHSKALPYLAHLHREIEQQAALFTTRKRVTQLHWGGGTPTFLNDDQMAELMAHTARHFELCTDDTGEYSIEVDPRKASPATIRHLRQLGFNRLSLGVQDFEPQVQKAVNRIQSVEETFAVMQAARDCGFHGVSVDLIYGLPHQTVQSFLRTLDIVLQASPDRLSVFNYAHLPERFMPQRRIQAEQLPPPAEKLAILRATIERLQAAGYIFIGMDHFAKPDDSLCRAQRQGQLHRNFQGYATHADCDLVALGVSAIGRVGDCFAQNVKTPDAYAAALSQARLPVEKGLWLSEDDRRRGRVIMQLICHFQLDYASFAREHGIHVAEEFPEALSQLAAMRDDGLLELNPTGIRVLPAGRLLIRNVCMAFDAYLGEQSAKRFSKVI